MATSEELKRQILEQKLEGNNENESNNESENESGGLGRIIDEPIVEKEEEEKEEVEENNTKVKVNKLDKFKTIEEQANAYVEAEKKISSQGKEVGELREQVKEMEELFGISYPTVKNRINGIASKLEFVEINPPASSNEILNQLDKGEISVEEAINKLGGNK